MYKQNALPWLLGIKTQRERERERERERVREREREREREEWLGARYEKNRIRDIYCTAASLLT